MNKAEQKFIRHLVRSPEWQVLEHLGQELMNKIKEEGTIGDTEWETVRAALMKEGKAEGIRMFLNELFNMGSQND